MKKMIFALLLIFFGIDAISQIQIVPYNGTSNRNANSRANARNFPNSFASMEEAKAAYFSGNFTYYVPSDTRNAGVNPIDGVNTVAAPLEADAVMRMPIVGGIRCVITQLGSVCRFQVINARMCQIPYALDECGNQIIEMEYVVANRQPAVVNNPPQVVYNRPCLTCPGEKQDYNYNLYQPSQNLNTYSDRQVMNYPIQQTVPYENYRKGMPTGVKVAIGVVVVGTLAYLILKPNASDPTDQNVETLPASMVPKTRGLKLNFSF